MSSLDQNLIPPEEIKRYILETPTKYEDRSCCGCRIAYFPEGHMTICGHWICLPVKPILIALAFLLLSTLGFYDIWAYGASIAEKVCLSIVLVFIMVCVIVSYLEIIIIGPGYLPFNYQYVKHDPWTWEDHMSSIVVFSEQMEVARELDRPPRACFSIRARRFVLRADHFCYWAESFIGLNNARYFLLMLLWVDIYSLYWILMHIPMCIYIHKHDGFEWPYLLTICGLCLIIPLFAVSAFHSFLSYRDAYHNWTSLERLKNRVLPVYDNGSCIANFEEICGDRKNRLLWPLPCFLSKPLVDGFYANY